ncbi:hypothetical protein BB559_002041 [Furculomyces boomerangus]|uniref:Uncharacterized protein n=2 Tax=Harpellales TaxID=61421 RepID=A0A2T9YYJ2_9FUNG|nr:hypothetical protein BB559_002041 [Furculomyces boomerangus]PVZ96971.1 hypothetical protein BB558_007097 [Smittium angustum]PVZ98246.1 hypothetical protein BB558_005758 [Smittium angustum]PWA01598.1 hypothetical protein BB558_002299 [Smittium angustum]
MGGKPARTISQKQKTIIFAILGLFLASNKAPVKQTKRQPKATPRKQTGIKKEAKRPLMKKSKIQSISVDTSSLSEKI